MDIVLSEQYLAGNAKEKRIGQIWKAANEVDDAIVVARRAAGSDGAQTDNEGEGRRRRLGIDRRRRRRIVWRERGAYGFLILILSQQHHFQTLNSKFKLKFLSN